MMNSIGLHRPVSLSSRPVRFGSEQVYNYDYNPLHTQLNQQQFTALVQGLQKVEASNQEIKATLTQGFKDLLAALTAPKVTAP